MSTSGRPEAVGRPDAATLINVRQAAANRGDLRIFDALLAPGARYIGGVDHSTEARGDIASAQAHISTVKKYDFSDFSDYTNSTDCIHRSGPVRKICNRSETEENSNRRDVTIEIPTPDT